VGNKYYESELQYLREMGREFAQVYPSTAGLLAERGSDPDVERLLEGFAFLSSRIRERIDDAVPDVVHGLMQLLLPHYLRPVPATSIIQYEPSLKGMRGIQTVPRGTRVSSKPVDGTACEFRTTQDVDLMPLRLENAWLDETARHRPTIRLRFETTEAGRGLLLRPEGIRLLLYGELSVSATLYLWLFRHFAGATLYSDDGQPFNLGDDVLQPIGFAEEEALIPWPRLGHEGYRYLQEYFCAPSKFLFVDITHLDRVGALKSDKFEIALTCDRPPDLNQRIGVENFRLFCTPVINVFETSADPVKRDPKVHEHLLRAAGVGMRHMEVYEVTSVVGVRQGYAERRQYEPFAGFHHAKDTRESSYYTLRPTSSPVDDGIDMYLSIVTPLGATPSTEEETLSLDLLCTNRSLPAELQLGEIAHSPKGLSSPAPFRNIAPVTNPVRPKLGSELLWRFLSHMSVARSSLADVEVLKAMLTLYNFQRETSPALGRANELKVEAIRSVEGTPVTRLAGGAPVRGISLHIEFEESKLGTRGEAFLLGCILDEVFATHAPLNSFNEFHMMLHPSRTELQWPARTGRFRLL